MDKGWGLTLDSIAINSFLNKRSRGILESGPMLDMPVGDERREVDFFAEKTRSVSVKKENSHVDEAAITDLDVNVIKNAYIPTELSSLFFFFLSKLLIDIWGFVLSSVFLTDWVESSDC